MNSMRFILLIKLARVAAANVELFDAEDPARERWRAAAIAAVTGVSFGGYAVTWAQLFAGPPVGSKLEARKLAEGGHLKELESSHSVATSPTAILPTEPAPALC
jgi:hypothetical protein